MFAAPNFYDWRAQQSSFEDLAAFQSKAFTLHSSDGEPEALRSMMVSASLMPLLRVRPQRGHLFTADHEVVGRDRVALISDALWHRRFGADPGIIGRTFTVGSPAEAATGRGDFGAWEIVGVMPPVSSFRSARLKPVDVWVPFVPSANEYPRGDGRSRNYNAQVIGRLKDGVTKDQAYEQMSQITGRLKAEHPVWFRDRWVGVVPLHESVVGKARGWMFLLLGSVAFSPAHRVRQCREPDAGPRLGAGARPWRARGVGRVALATGARVAARRACCSRRRAPRSGSASPTGASRSSARRCPPRCRASPTSTSICACCLSRRRWP